MTSENPQWRRFNDSMIPGATLVPAFHFNERASAAGADARIQRASRPYFRLELADARLNEEQKDYLLAMVWASRGTKRVLMRCAAFSEIGLLNGFNSNGVPQYLPSFQFHGNGSLQTFQLVKPIVATGYESEPDYYNVTKPQWDYPPFTNWRGDVSSVNMADVSFYGGPPNYTPLSIGLFAVNRDNGRVTTSYNGDIYAKGGFYILMLLPPELPLQRKPDETGMFYSLGNISLEEPPGG